MAPAASQRVILRTAEPGRTSEHALPASVGPWAWEAFLAASRAVPFSFPAGLGTHFRQGTGSRFHRGHDEVWQVPSSLVGCNSSLSVKQRSPARWPPEQASSSGGGTSARACCGAIIETRQTRQIAVSPTRRRVFRRFTRWNSLLPIIAVSPHMFVQVLSSSSSLEARCDCRTLCRSAAGGRPRPTVRCNGMLGGTRCLCNKPILSCVREKLAFSSC
jgi:hypothetical protein